MVVTSQRIMKKFLLFIFLLPLLLYGQRPFINDFVPNGVPVGDTINIIGSNLGSDLIAPKVFFGGVAASSVEFINDRFIRAVVPSGALYGSITVINHNELLAQSRQNFLLSFHGGNTINTFDDEYIQSAGSNAYDICMCDLDANGLNDIVITHNNETGNIGEVSLFLNNTTGTGSLSGSNFVRTMTMNHSNMGGFISTTCADLDLDGLPELLFTTNVGTTNEHIIIYKNSGIVAGELDLTALTGTPLRLPQTSEGNNRTPRRLKVADIDRDGHPDIVVGNEEDNTFHVFKNTTFGENITFNEDAIEIMITLETSSEGTETGSIDLADFNNDGLVDVVALPFRAPNQPIYVFQNTSVVDEIAFIQAEGISELSRRVNIGTADFDNDGLIDIITTNNRGNEMSIYRNITAEEGAEIRFESSGIKIDLSSTSGTLGLWNVDFADFDGDGLVDIISTSTGFLVTGLSIIKNTSGDVAGQAISFADPELIETTNTSLNVCAGDLNNDGKPDIAFTHDVALNSGGNLGIFLNRNCVSPEITPDENLSFCLNQDFTLQATHTVGASYQWDIAPSATGNISYVEGDTSRVIISITSGSRADISVTINQDECRETTTTGFSILGGTVPSQPQIQIVSLGGAATANVGRVCAGEAVTLFTVGGGIGATTNVYEWRLPDGSIGTNNTIPFNASAENAGIYSVSVQQNGTGCYSSPSAPFRLEVNELPFVKIVNSVVGATSDFCEGRNPTLNLLVLDSNYSYQWLEGGVGIPGEDSDALDIDQTGDYSVIVTDDDVDCAIESPIYSARRLPSPRVNVMGRSNVCAGDNEIYTSLATGARGFPLEYSWKIDSAGGIEIFNSGRQDDLETITRSFSLYDNYRITHTASYSTDQISPLCFEDTTFAVISSPAPEITFNVKNDTFKCPLDTILVEVINPAPNNVDTYEWFVNDANRNADTSFLQVYVPRSENIDSVYAKVSLVNDIGCSVTDSVRIINYDTTSLKINTELIDGDTTVESITYPLILLSADNSVELLATGGSDYNWDPAASIDNPTGNSVTFYPVRPLSFVSLNGKDANGCENSYSVAVILNNVRPRKTFSPNNDGQGFDCWEILNTSEQENCTVYIFDARGKNILVETSPFEENCVWDGTHNGFPVPEGIYYFVLKCENEMLSTTGTILLAR